MKESRINKSDILNFDLFLQAMKIKLISTRCTKHFNKYESLIQARNLQGNHNFEQLTAC